MKITLSKSQWENIGEKAGWIKTAKITADGLEQIVRHLDEILMLMDQMGKQEVYSFANEKRVLMSMRMQMDKDANKFRGASQNYRSPNLDEHRSK